MSKTVPPPVPLIKPRLESFNSFYSTLPDGSRQKPIPFPRTSQLTTGELSESNLIIKKDEGMKEIMEKLKKFHIYIEFEDISEAEYLNKVTKAKANIKILNDNIYLVPNPVNSKLADVIKPMAKTSKFNYNNKSNDKQFVGL
uniref:Uncharacterized protein n=1 Tax=Parastrongyloides trichosuri TaxID=131310 RepID=A0A0N5A7E1_PARTI